MQKSIIAWYQADIDARDTCYRPSLMKSPKLKTEFNFLKKKKNKQTPQFCKNIKNIMKKDEQIAEHIWKGEYLKSFLPGNKLRSILIKYSYS